VSLVDVVVESVLVVDVASSLTSDPSALDAIDTGLSLFCLLKRAAI